MRTLPLISTPARHPGPSARSLRIVTGFALVLALLAGWRLWAAYRLTQLPGTPASVAAVEARYGIHVTHIAVLADGGLIDFRFQVLDPNKAAPLFNLDKRPILIVENNGRRVDSLYHPPHSHAIVAGQSQYFIYNNLGGAIQPGVEVAVLLGDLRLEHLLAQ